jgi:lycopene beta-cyclase
MTHPPTWDIVIAGGGLSGLAMAVELAQPQFSHLKILLVEQRSHYQRDRTWSYWASNAVGTCAHDYEHLERSRWSHWQLAHAGDKVISNGFDHIGGNFSYRTIDADDFYADTMAKITACPHIELRLGTTVSSIGALGVGADRPCQVKLEQMGCSEVVYTKLLIDARPARVERNTAEEAAASLVQHFVGWEIEMDPTGFNFFDPTTPDLMDFRPATDGLHFFYVLPYSPNRALVEATWVSAPNLQPDYAAQLRSYIAKRWKSPRYRTLYEEKGSLPLLPITTTSTTSIAKTSQLPAWLVHIGRGAGTLRASTGFAFLETLADCKRLSHQISAYPFHANDAVARKPLLAFQRGAVDRWMDHLFLHVMASNWVAAPSLFIQLFKNTPTDRLIRFLSGNANALDRLYVITSLPKKQFLMPLARALTTVFWNKLLRFCNHWVSSAKAKPSATPTNTSRQEK